MCLEHLQAFTNNYENVSTFTNTHQMLHNFSILLRTHFQLYDHLLLLYIITILLKTLTLIYECGALW
jgi:hypothetical protein